MPARLAVGSLCTIAAAAVLVPLLDRFPPVCFYRAATGHLCLFCGMTHALAHVAHGQWAAAMAANPAWLPILAGFVYTIARADRRISWLAVGAVVVGTALRW
jgi:hypothetical protein